MKTNALVWTVLAAPCASGVAASQVLPEDTPAFRSLVESRVPVGTSLQEATSRMEALGLSCSSSERWDPQGKQISVAIFCTRKQGSLVFRSWNVELRVDSGRVSSLSAAVGLTGP
jgi:hypothetical protein